LNSSKIRYKENASLMKSIDYIEVLFTNLNSLHFKSVIQIDIQQLTTLVNQCQIIVNDTTIIDDDHIYPSLLDLTNYLITINTQIKKTKKIKLMPIDSNRLSQDSLNSKENANDKSETENVQNGIRKENLTNDQTKAQTNGNHQIVYETAEQPPFTNGTDGNIGLKTETDESDQLLTNGKTLTPSEVNNTVSPNVAAASAFIDENENDRENVNNNKADDRIDEDEEDEEEGLTDKEERILKRIKKLDAFCIVNSFHLAFD
jgi:hypothetical protein